MEHPMLLWREHGIDMSHESSHFSVFSAQKVGITLRATINMWGLEVHIGASPDRPLTPPYPIYQLCASAFYRM